MKYIKNNREGKNNILFDSSILSEKKDQGIHPDMIVGAFRVKDIRPEMTVSGVYISDIVEKLCVEFVVIKKDTFYKNIPSKDTFLSPGQKIKINDKDKRVETLIDNKNIYKLTLPETKSIHFLSNKKDYLYIHNIQIVCGNYKKELDDLKINDDLYL
jgi:hypothetical protein